MREKLILILVVFALLATMGFLSYQVYERNQAINNLQMQILWTQIVLGMCKRTNEGLQEKIPREQVSNLLNYSSRN
jgi:predicted negative regulator of RcsB-dependent stress response